MTITRILTGLVMSLALLGGCGGGQDGKEQSEAPTTSQQTAEGAKEAAGTRPADAADSRPARAKPPMAFVQCRSCHSVEPGRKGIGPTLHGIFGKKAGSVAGFDYTPALKDSGIVWNRDTLDEWLAGPMQMVPGTRMVVPVRDAQRRKEIIDYLETLE